MIEVFAYRERELRNVRHQLRLIKLCMKALKLTPQQLMQIVYPTEQSKKQQSVDVPYAENGISEGNGLIITRDVDGVFDELDALHKIELYQLARR